MELTSVVYNSTLIFILILSALLIVVFLLSQSRKDQLSFSERKTKTRNISSLNDTLPVTANVYNPRKYHSTETKSENTIKFKYNDEEPVQIMKMSKNSRPVKPVSRGSLVREHYNSGSFAYSHKGRNSKGKNNNIIKFN